MSAAHFALITQYCSSNVEEVLCKSWASLMEGSDGIVTASSMASGRNVFQEQHFRNTRDITVKFKPRTEPGLH